MLRSVRAFAAGFVVSWRLTVTGTSDKYKDKNITLRTMYRYANTYVLSVKINLVLRC